LNTPDTHTHTYFNNLRGYVLSHSWSQTYWWSNSLCYF